jgi:hypothetical protein
MFRKMTRIFSARGRASSESGSQGCQGDSKLCDPPVHGRLPMCLACYGYSLKVFFSA